MKLKNPWLLVKIIYCHIEYDINMTYKYDSTYILAHQRVYERNADLSYKNWHKTRLVSRDSHFSEKLLRTNSFYDINWFLKSRSSGLRTFNLNIPAAPLSPHRQGCVPGAGQTPPDRFVPPDPPRCTLHLSGVHQGVPRPGCAGGASGWTCHWLDAPLLHRRSHAEQLLSR